MPFNIRECAIPEVWCGKGAIKASTDPLVRYVRIGKPYECMQKGMGAASKKNTPQNSVRNIKYIGEIHEENFAAAGIKTLSVLFSKMRSKSSEEIRTFLKRVLKRSDGTLDKRAYNSVLVTLYQNGMSEIPACMKLPRVR